MFSKRELELIHLSVKESYIKETAKSKALPISLREERKELANEYKELMNKVGSLVFKQED